MFPGADNPSIVGAYLYADFVTGRVWALVWDGSQVVYDEELLSVTNPASFGEDQDGEVYIGLSRGKGSIPSARPPDWEEELYFPSPPG